MGNRIVNIKNYDYQLISTGIDLAGRVRELSYYNPNMLDNPRINDINRLSQQWSCIVKIAQKWNDLFIEGYMSSMDEGV